MGKVFLLAGINRCSSLIIPPGEEIELEVEYEGRIDEDIYLVNIPDDEFFSPAARYSQKEN